MIIDEWPYDVLSKWKSRYNLSSIHVWRETAKFTFGCHARLSLCTLNRRFSLAKRCSTRLSLSLVLRGRLVCLPQTKCPRSWNLLMMPSTMLLWRPTYLAIFRYEHPFRQYPTTIPAICSIEGRTIITSICRLSLVIVVFVFWKVLNDICGYVKIICLKHCIVWMQLLLCEC